MPSNVTIANVVLSDVDLNFKGQTFSRYAFPIKNAQAADVPGRFASTRTAPAVELLLFSLLLRWRRRLLFIHDFIVSLPNPAACKLLFKMYSRFNVNAVADFVLSALNAVKNSIKTSDFS